MKPQVEHIKGFFQQHIRGISDAKLFSTVDKAIERHGSDRDALGPRQFVYFGPTPKEVLGVDLLPPKTAMQAVSLGEKHRPLRGTLSDICRVVGGYTRVAFDFVVAQRYQDFDHVLYHSDSGLILGPRIDDIAVAILSLGSSRWFSIREIGASKETTGFIVAHGDLVVMRGKMQSHFEHALFPTSRPRPPRISLSFCAYTKDSWAFRSKQLFTLVEFQPRASERRVQVVARGSKEMCVRRWQKVRAQTSSKSHMVVGPDLVPTHIYCGKGFTAAEKKRVVKQYPKAKVEG